MSVRERIRQLAFEFTTAVLAQLRAANVAELGEILDDAATPKRTRTPSATRRRRPARLKRRTMGDLETSLASVVEALKNGPLGSEAIRKIIGMDAREWPKVVELGLKTKVLSKKGEKRATVYSTR